METKKINWVLWVGLAIPVVVIIVVFIMSLLSRQGFTPKYDFLYYFNNGYGYCYNGDSYYYVKDGQINQTDIKTDYPNRADCIKDKNILAGGSFNRIYRYSVIDEKSYPLTLIEAQKLKLDVGPVSPAGENIHNDYGYNNSGIFEIFGGRRYDYNSSYYLIDENKKIKIVNIVTPNNNSYYDFKFIGWIIK